MSRVFRIGYVEEYSPPFNYPCFFKGKKACKAGISGDIWVEIAKQLNLTLEFHKADAYGKLLKILSSPRAAQNSQPMVSYLL